MAKWVHRYVRYSSPYLLATDADEMRAQPWKYRNVSDYDDGDGDMVMHFDEWMETSDEH